MDLRIVQVLDFLNPPKGFRPWHGGPTLLGALRGVDHIAANWKPYHDRHNIWELALHIAYWKYSVLRYLDPETEKGFPRSPANWAEINDFSDRSWRGDLKLIKEQHQKLVAAIEQFPADRLDDKIADGKDWTFIQLLMGSVAHDIHHIGQIQYLKRLYVSGRRATAS